MVAARGVERASRVPDAFLIGVPRSGSTSLYHGLAAHPQIFAPDLKEICFTCPDIDPGTRRSRTKWVYDRADYLSNFAAARPNQVIVEGCIYNIYSPKAPTLVNELNPNALALVQLRDPIDQMRSNHAMKLVNVDLHDPDFARTLATQAVARGGRTEVPPNFGDYDLRDKAKVSTGLARFVEVLGRERVHVNLYEDFAADPAAVFRATYRFLGVDEAFEPPVRQLVPNQTPWSKRLNRAMASGRVIDLTKRMVPDRLHPAAHRLAAAAFRANRRIVSRGPLPPDLEAQLREEFRPEVDRLSALVDRDLAARWWGDERAGEPASFAPAPRPDPSAGRVTQQS